MKNKSYASNSGLSTELFGLLIVYNTNIKRKKAVWLCETNITHGHGLFLQLPVMLYHPPLGGQKVSTKSKPL